MFKKNKRKKEYKKLKKEYLKSEIKNIFFHKHSYEKNNLNKDKNNLNIDQELMKKIPQLNPDLIIHKLALIVDGKVADILVCELKLATILTSNVKIVRLPENQDIKPGWYYINNGFEPPEMFVANVDGLKNKQEE